MPAFERHRQDCYEFQACLGYVLPQGLEYLFLSSLCLTARLSSQCPCLQLVYDGIPKGDLQQRELQLSVLSEQGFWENLLLGEVHIRLRELDLAQEKTGWFGLGSRGHGTL